MKEYDHYYQILGLDKSASEHDIRQAYRDLAKVWHPDRFAHDPRLQQKAQNKLKEINEAYEILKSLSSGRRSEREEARNNRHKTDNPSYKNEYQQETTNIFDGASRKWNVRRKFYILFSILVVVVAVSFLLVEANKRKGPVSSQLPASSVAMPSPIVTPSPLDRGISPPIVSLRKERITNLLDSFIQSKAMALGAEENVEFRRVQYGDLDSDGDDDVVTTYVIEGVNGGNNAHVQMAAFINNNGVPKFADRIIFRDYEQIVELKRIDKGVILCQSYKWAPNDPHCCPSIKNIARFSLINRKLSELKTK